MKSIKKSKTIPKNKSDLNAYFEVGRLIVEAQGGEKRAKYGNKLIKEYSEKLTKELGKGYNATNLKRMRQFYLLFEKGAAVRHLFGSLTWTHYKYLLPLNDDKKSLTILILQYLKIYHIVSLMKGSNLMNMKE